MNRSGETDPAIGGLDAFLALVDDPGHIQAFYGLHKALEHTAPMESFERTMLSVPAIARLVDERWEPPPYTLAQLAALPRGSLGQVHAERMVACGLDPGIIERNARAASVDPGESELERKVRYLTRRRTMTHDIHHTVTGFATDLPGEVGLSALYVVQIHHPVSLLYLTAVLLHAMPDADTYGRALHCLGEGLALGGKAENLLAQRWELAWERPLAHWRAELRIAPATHAPMRV